MRKTKIVCTLGPVCCREEVLRAMLRAGMNVARCNFSHGTHDYHRENIELFRRVRDEMGVPAAVMLDTKGPEIRLGDFEGGRAELTAGETFTLHTAPMLGDASGAYVTYTGLPGQVHAGDTVLIDDGHIVLRVEETGENEVTCRVIDGGRVSNHKSINVPLSRFPMPYLSAVDKQDLLFGISMNVDFVAASFVRRRDDVLVLRKFLRENGGGDIQIIAKIENAEGVENFDEILAAADGVMVARGDMGVEIAYERLPGIQKRFIRRCCQSGKIVITATQMLESMIENPMPTRAEITDVANAVFDGTSAVMLSGETAVGHNPAGVVAAMAKIVEQAEKDARELDLYRPFQADTESGDTTNAICDAACTTARDLSAKAILAVTKSGKTARRVSKFRPVTPIIAVTPSEKTYHQLAVSWGVSPVMAEYQPDSDSLFRHATARAEQSGLCQKGDLVVVTAGVPLDTVGTTNLLKVENV